MYEYLSDFAKGLVIGVSIAAPVGPIGVLCIRTTIAEGMLAGFVTGLGAATADGLYAAIGAFGVAAITSLLQSATPYLRGVGILVLLWLGWTTWRQKPSDKPAETAAKGRSLGFAFAGTFALTMTNPMTILFFAAIFAGAGLTDADTKPALDQALVLVAGAFMGSLAWWLFLSGSVAAFRAKIGLSTLTHINKISAAILIGFAGWMAAQALAH